MKEIECELPGKNLEDFHNLPRTQKLPSCTTALKNLYPYGIVPISYLGEKSARSYFGPDESDEEDQGCIAYPYLRAIVPSDQSYHDEGVLRFAKHLLDKDSESNDMCVALALPSKNVHVFPATTSEMVKLIENIKKYEKGVFEHDGKDWTVFKNYPYDDDYRIGYCGYVYRPNGYRRVTGTNLFNKQEWKDSRHLGR